MCVVSTLKGGLADVEWHVVHLCCGSTVCEGKMGLQVNTEGVLCKQQLFSNVVCIQKTGLYLENRVPECWAKSYWFWDRLEVVEPV